MRKRHTAKFKANVALKALREDKTLGQLTSEFGVQKGQISVWKKTLLESAESCFTSKSKADKETKEAETLIDELHRQIGVLKVENDWLKKKL